MNYINYLFVHCSIALYYLNHLRFHVLTVTVLLEIYFLMHTCITYFSYLPCSNTTLPSIHTHEVRRHICRGIW